MHGVQVKAKAAADSDCAEADGRGVLIHLGGQVVRGNPAVPAFDKAHLNRRCLAHQPWISGAHKRQVGDHDVLTRSRLDNLARQVECSGRRFGDHDVTRVGVN